MIKFSAPGKVHLLGEHAVVYGKPALLVTVGLRVVITLTPCHSGRASLARMTKTIEPVVKKYLKIKTIPPYKLEMSSQLPIGAGLGSSAAISAAYIAALLTFLKVNRNKALVNGLTYQAEEIFHGNPSGGDNSTVVFGGLVWFRRETPDLKIIQPLPFSISSKLSKNFILINTGKPKETTREMVRLVESRVKKQETKYRKIFDNQEELVKELLTALKEGNEDKLIQIIRAGEKNLESLGVVSPFAKSIIRKIEQAGGAAKICGGGGKTGPTGVLLAYHCNKNTLEKIAKSEKLPYFSTSLGVEGLRRE
ncbi:mevalonate kinase [Candidatus Daviesbacteria bacterium]|nr:mevalonate kinase [Candidatus Daviesbacteria bacterium]